MSTFLSYLSESFPPKAKFSVNDIPDLTGKVTIVTGANTGVGKETAKALLARNAKVYLAGRSQEKVEAAIKELKEETGKEGVFLALDLSDLKSIKHAAEEFLRKEKELHVLFNNAGVMVPPLEQVTAQGYDLQFGTNVLGHFYLTKLLLPALISTSKSSNWRSRVVHTSSSSSMSGQIDFDTLKDGPGRNKSNTPYNMYAQSKLGNIIVSNEFAKRHGKDGVVFASVNPGNLKTDLLRHVPGFARTLANMLLYPPAMGALTQLWAGTTDAGLGMNGKYLIPWARMGTPNPLALDEKLREEVWKWLEEQVENV